MNTSSSDTQILATRRTFQTTRWGLVRASHDAAAKDELVAIYWRPLYFFVRRQGHDNETAKDIVQGFLATLIERDAFTKADPARGRFRTFLLAALTNYMKDLSKSALSEKRGGGAAIRSLDFDRGEREYLQIASNDDPPETVLNRAWARSLLEQSISELRGEPSHLAAFRAYADGAGYVAICERTGLSPSAAKTAIHRLKRKLRQIVTGHLRATAASEEEVAVELSEFLALVS